MVYKTRKRAQGIREKHGLLLKKVIGSTATQNRSFSQNPVTGEIAYPAGM